jgi:hypothetical protein
MKKIASLLLIFLLTGGYLSAQQQAAGNTAAALPKNGKAFLQDYYEKTFKALQSDVAGLSSAQLQFKPAPDKWSVSQCLEHIVLTEKALFDFAQQGMKAPANPERRAEVKVTDEMLINGINDRSQKATASEDLTGKGAYNDPKVALNALQSDRKSILEYISSIPVDSLRSHISDSPFGPVDAYQALLFVAGHTSRHTLQIEEVKSDKNFPKK